MRCNLSRFYVFVLNNVFNLYFKASCNDSDKVPFMELMLKCIIEHIKRFQLTAGIIYFNRLNDLAGD